MQSVLSLFYFCKFEVHIRSAVTNILWLNKLFTHEINQDLRFLVEPFCLSKSSPHEIVTILRVKPLSFLLFFQVYTQPKSHYEDINSYCLFAYNYWNWNIVVYEHSSMGGSHEVTFPTSLQGWSYRRRVSRPTWHLAWSGYPSCIRDYTNLLSVQFIITWIFIMQGLCLVDWGRGIDLSLFPENTEFKGDCRTSGFRCVEMQEHKPWKFQVSTSINYESYSRKLLLIEN